jgi:hypothetical protein
MSHSYFSKNKQNFHRKVWVGCSSNGFIWVWDLKDYELKMRIAVDETLGFRTLLYTNGIVKALLLGRFIFSVHTGHSLFSLKIWAGSKDGKLNIFSTKTFEHEKSLDAHKDTIRSLCLIDGR